MSQNPYHKAEFLISAPELSILPTDLLREVAFAGRSNAGKSSALNTITEQKSLARTSKTPGRTQAINVFALGDGLALVDLPGYGYAKVPDRIRKHWNQALPAYLEKRQSLVGLVVIMDVRHPLTELDQQMLRWSGAAELPTHCLLTKADKLKRGPAMNTLQKVQNQLKNEFPHATAQLFSSQTRAGVEEARAVLNHWFELG